jgi:hypothetical protein
VRVDTVDIIQSVNGTAVTTPSDYFAAVNGTTAGSSVTLQVQRMARANPTAPLTTQALTISITSQNLLPDVAATGQALLDAIWQERRVELAMEEQRWFDIRRQNGVAPGRAALLMAAAGKTFVARDTLYPIPSGEVQIAGLQQNPGY